MNPSVSVIIPTYNRAPLLTDALESVLRQTYAPLEIIVVDDGSTDDTPRIALDCGDPVRLFSQNNRGPAAARNLGIANARGDILAFLDDDDMWLPQALDWSIQRFEDPLEPDAEIVCGLTQRVKHVQRTTNAFTYEPIPPTWATLSFCSASCRREVFARVGLLDESLRYGEDVDWFMRAREQGIHFAFITQVTHLYRIHENNVTRDREKANRFFLATLHKSLARRAEANIGIVTPLPELPDLEALNQALHNELESKSFPIDP